MRCHRSNVCEKTLLFIFEDLHWADLSTLDLVSALARRRNPAKLMLLASYRPADVEYRPASTQAAKAGSGHA